ncbi:MAG: DNA-binding response regulator [Candidatus Neomarinimicrobiota bacterium]|nr:MAG: DNA-binding response regulator [Candidatus Neomarinimicrobiota bacterium]
MITCIAIDDEPLALKQIAGYIDKIPDLKLLGTFSSAVKALEFLHTHDVDLLFVDIQMPDLSGMDLVKSLARPPKVIFTTAYREYAVEGFAVDAADYLVKPISFAAFAKAVDKTRQRYFSREPSPALRQEGHFLFIKSEYKIIRLDVDDITYIEGMRDYVRIHLIRGKPVLSLLDLKAVAAYLPADRFLRVHRSYIVNLSRIRSIERNRIYIDEDVIIPVGERYREDFRRFLDDKFLK